MEFFTKHVCRRCNKDCKVVIKEEHKVVRCWGMEIDIPRHFELSDCCRDEVFEYEVIRHEQDYEEDEE